VANKQIAPLPSCSDRERKEEAWKPGRVSIFCAHVTRGHMKMDWCLGRNKANQCGLTAALSCGLILLLNRCYSRPILDFYGGLDIDLFTLLIRPSRILILSETCQGVSLSCKMVIDVLVVTPSILRSTGLIFRRYI
jgi:hypothetical protein